MSCSACQRRRREMMARGPDLLIATALLCAVGTMAVCLVAALVGRGHHGGGPLVRATALYEDTIRPPLRRTGGASVGAYRNGDRPVSSPDLIGERITRSLREAS